MAAPVTAILAYDIAFYANMAELFPHAAPGPSSPATKPASATAKQSGTLQAAYFILALRAVGLDAGPMGGFDKARSTPPSSPARRYAPTSWSTSATATTTTLFPRSPRLDFEEIASFA